LPLASTPAHALGYELQARTSGGPLTLYGSYKLLV